MTHIPKPDEIVPEALRQRLRWDGRHERMAAKIMVEFNLILPRDRELTRQLTFVRVQQEPPAISTARFEDAAGAVLERYDPTQRDMTSTLAARSAPGREGNSSAPLRSDEMDLREFMGTNYIGVDDIVANGSREETIIDIQIGNYGRPDLYFKDGSRLSLNVTNTRTLGRAFGTESRDSIGKTIEVYIGEIETREGKQNSVLIRPISPTKTPELGSGSKSQAVDQDPNDEIPL